MDLNCEYEEKGLQTQFSHRSNIESRVDVHNVDKLVKIFMIHSGFVPQRRY